MKHFDVVITSLSYGFRGEYHDRMHFDLIIKRIFGVKTVPIQTAIFLVFSIGLIGATKGADPVTDGEKLFAIKIKPLFAEKCNACHGNDEEELKGGFDMRDRESLLRGGESYGEEVVVLGEGSKSFLYIATTREEEGLEMPPKLADRLTKEQALWIRHWIDGGAPWPDDKRSAMIQEEYSAGEMVKTSGGLSDDWTNRRYEPEHLWAYRALEVADVPEGVHPIDWFIDRRLQSLHLPPAPIAAPRELARRLSFGLTGLPPTPEDMSKFVDDFALRPDVAVKTYSTRLMESPQYGEHFGRHWLDVVRYADSAGFANDYSRPNAWRYRDYVIRAFNSDKPYNEFVREQLAGDEIDDTDVEHLVATGFLRMGPWEQTGMSVFKVTRHQWLDDITDSVGQTFLGHALQCAKCHDHKFDPVPTRDYYSMKAVFSTTQFAERNAPFFDSENLHGFDATARWTEAKIAGYQEQQQELNQLVQKRRKAEGGDAKVGDNGLDPGDEASLARMRKNILRHTWELDKTRPIAFSVYTGKTVQKNNVSNRLVMPKKPWGQGYLEKDVISSGGDPFAEGAPVTPGPLSVAVELGQMSDLNFADGQATRRLELANWIVDKKNPLTARVVVNRVWAWHFGQGIAGNPNNLGATGKLPTHPELLDYLAHWFVENGWSIKKLNALIHSSTVYRRSSRHQEPDALSDADPGQTSYAAFLPRRLTAEELRDAMLSASGELNQQVGGVPCRPDINLEVAMQPRQIMGGTASVYEPDPQPEQRHRRSIYAEKIRGLRNPFFETFNQPGPDKSCELRETSTVTPQALTLMNSIEVQNRALAFAARLLRNDGSDDAKIRRAFLVALGRPPTDDEQAACLAHWQAATVEEQSKKHGEREFPTQVTRTVMAEKTGEPYEFVEYMPAYEGYVRDMQPSQTDARTRGLAQLCLVLFNLNEFAYLD